VTGPKKGIWQCCCKLSRLGHRAKASTRSAVLDIGVSLGASLILTLRIYVRFKWGPPLQGGGMTPALLPALRPVRLHVGFAVRRG
jgi:hypothetical protein